MPKKKEQPKGKNTQDDHDNLKKKLAMEEGVEMKDGKLIFK